VFESENREADILKEIEKGIRLRHVKTDDRSNPNLKGDFNRFLPKSKSLDSFRFLGIRQFRRQTTKEDRQNQPIFDEDFADTDEVEDVDKLRDDLESMKQLISLEVRSKMLLEKENKRLKDEIERLKNFKSVNMENETEKDKECNVLKKLVFKRLP